MTNVTASSPVICPSFSPKLEALHDETNDMPKRFIGKLPILQKKDISQDIDIFLLSNRYHFLILHLTKSALNPKFGNALKICQHLHGLAHGHVYIYVCCGCDYSVMIILES